MILSIVIIVFILFFLVIAKYAEIQPNNNRIVRQKKNISANDTQENKDDSSAITFQKIEPQKSANDTQESKDDNCAIISQEVEPKKSTDF